MGGVWGKYVTPIFQDIVSAEYKYFFDLFNSLYQSAAQELTVSPSSFAGVGDSITSSVINISSNIILPFAAVILAYNFAKEIFDMVLQHNNMAEVDIFSIFKSIFKMGLSSIIVVRCYEIVLGFFDIGTYLVSSVASTSMSIDSSAVAEFLGSETNDGMITVYLLLGLLIGIIILITVALILITVWSRLINIYITIAISPIPIATILSSGSLGQIGSGFIKNVLAVSLQGFIIALLMSINTTILQAAFTHIETMYDLLKVVILLITSTITISKSLSLAKTAVGLAG